MMQNAVRNTLLDFRGNAVVKQVLNIIEEIVLAANEGSYLFRGEPKCYPLVSSGLYRKHLQLSPGARDMNLIEQEIVKSARRFITETDEVEILSQLQHFGYRTNFIDFTTDYNIALFFACDGYFQEDGRILFLEDVGPFEIVTPPSPQNRVISQKSRFVRPHLGFVEPDRSVVIPHFLKKHILKYLADYHGMTSKSIYNDIHGFIRYSALHTQANEEFDKGVAQIEKGTPADGIAHCTEAIRLNPRFAAAYANRAGFNYKLGRYDHALRDCNEAISIELESDSAYNIRGLIYRKRGHKDLAMQDFNRVVELFPVQPIGYYNRGLLYQESGDFSGAVEDFSHAIELNPDYGDAYSSRGASHNSLKHYSQAIQDFSKAIELDSNNGAAFLGRGFAYFQKGEHDQAIPDYSKAIEINYLKPEAYSRRGSAHFFNGNLGSAIDDCTQAIRLDSEYADAYRNRANAFFAQGMLDPAVDDYTKAIELDHRNYDAFLNRGSAYMEMSEFRLAIEDFNAAVALDPECADGYFSRCIALLVTREYVSAQSDIAKLKELKYDLVSALGTKYGDIETFQEHLQVRLPMEILEAFQRQRMPIVLGEDSSSQRRSVLFPRE